MTVQSSGAISIQDVVDEFGGNTPHSLTEHYGDDPYKGVPESGTLSLDDFYGTSLRTCKLTLGKLRRVGSSDTSDSHARYGYAASGKSNYWHFEGSDCVSGGMGSTTRSSSIITSGTLLGFQAIEYSSSKSIELMTSRSTNGGWTSLNFTIGSPFGVASNIYSLSRSAAGDFDAQFGNYKPGFPDVSGVYKWIWSSATSGGTYTYHTSSLGGVSWYTGGSNIGIDTLVGYIISAYNNSDPIYMSFV